MPALTAGYEPALESGLMPDGVVRAGIRRLLRARLREQARAHPEGKARFVAGLASGPIAVETAAANEQHYEVPASFFEAVLGRHLKYSAGYWPEGVEARRMTRWHDRPRCPGISATDRSSSRLED